MRALRLAWEVLCILALLCLAFVLLPFWWAWLGWQWSAQRREAFADVATTETEAA